VTRAGTLAVSLAVCSLVAGCGGDDDEQDSNRAAVYQAPTDGSREIPLSPAAAEAHRQLTARAQRGDELTEEAYAEYEEAVAAMAYLLDAYWSDAFRENGLDTYRSPADVYGYYPGEDTDVICGGEDAATPENAFYCGGTNEIGWDEPGLFLPYFFERGELAVGIVLAHEWGHLVQARADAGFGITYEQELNADCLAGAWLRGMDRADLLDGVAPGDAGDIDLALETIFGLGDAPGTPFEDPQAHGQPKERLAAVALGYADELDGCIDEYWPGFAKANGIAIPRGGAAAQGDAL